MANDDAASAFVSLYIGGVSQSIACAERTLGSFEHHCANTNGSEAMKDKEDKKSLFLRLTDRFDQLVVKFYCSSLVYIGSVLSERVRLIAGCGEILRVGLLGLVYR